MRRLALLLLLAPALLALPADGQPVPEGGGGGDCPQGSNVVFASEADPELVEPSGIDVDADGNVWVADSGTASIYKFDQDGNQLGVIPGVVATPDLVDPVDVVIDDATGRIFVADAGTNRIHRFIPAGFQDLTIGPTSGQPDLADPSSIALNPDGSRIWVLDPGTDTVQRFDATTGDHTLTFPTTNTQPDATNPSGLAVDPAGDLGLVDLATDSAFRLDRSGEQTLAIAPSAGSPTLGTPEDVAFDAAGNLLVIDLNTSTIQRFGATGARQFVIDGVVNGGLEEGVALAVGRRGDVWAIDDGTDKIMRWCFRVDAKLRRGAGAFVGDTTVNGTGAGQVLTSTVRRNVATNFTFRLDGESNAQHRIRVKAPATPGVRWFNGNQNVTAAVNGAGFVTPFLVPGFTRDLRIEVRTSVARTITIRAGSVAAPGRVDVVKLAVRV